MFEVTPEQEHPFTVLTRDSIQTKVLGTRFNISSYAEEERTSITVLEGRVSVTRNTVNMGILNKQEGLEYHTTLNNFLPLKITDVNRIEGWIKGEWEFDTAWILQG